MTRSHLFRFGSFLFFIACLAISSRCSAPVSAFATTTAWRGEYFDNTTLTDPPSLVRDDPDIDFVWSASTSPAPGFVGADHYSIRWTRLLYFDATDNWTFTTVNDDGMRVWVDDAITVDAWYDQGPTQHAGTIYLNAGWHNVRVEYYNRVLGGTARLSYARQGAMTAWQGDYFGNPDLSGSPTFTRDDPAVDFDWGTGSPDPALPADHFSVRWTRTLYFDAGTWRFTTTTDDGVRLWVDGLLMIDHWYDQSLSTYWYDLALAAGSHTVRLEFYDDYMNAVARLSYTRLGGVPTGAWLGQYYDNDSLDGTPVFSRYDPAINFNWGTESPAAGLPIDRFSIKWDSTQTLVRSGNYSIAAAADDGIRVWMDGALVIDAWSDHPATPLSAARWLNMGTHTLHVEYYERTVNASVSVQLLPGATPVSSGGDVIVDDRTPGWQSGAAMSDWRDAWSGFGGQSLWTLNHADAAAAYLWARWYPALPHAGYYQVSAYIPSGIATTLNALYWIYHNGRYAAALRAQGQYSNQWISLGTYYFAATGGEFVSLSDVTSECALCRAVVFDAIRFSPR